MKNPVDFDWYCKTKKDVINNAAYELIVALTAKSAPPRKFELSIPQRDDEMIANVVEGAINAVEAQIGYYWVDYQLAMDRFTPDYDYTNLAAFYVDLVEYLVMAVRLYFFIREQQFRSIDRGKYDELVGIQAVLQKPA